MNLEYSIKSGDYLYEPTERKVRLCLYADMERAFYVCLKLGTLLNSTTFELEYYNLSNPLQVRTLNKFYNQPLQLKTYDIVNGSTILRGDDEMILMGLFETKILNKQISRPLLFDLVGANRFTRKKLTEDVLYDLVLGDQGYTNYIDFTEFVYALEKDADLNVIQEYQLPRKKITAFSLNQMTSVAKSKAFNLAPDLFDIQTLNKIKNEKLKTKLEQLVTETIKIGIDNDQFGFIETLLPPETEFSYTYKDKKGNEREFPEEFKINGSTYRQAISKDGKIIFTVNTMSGGKILYSEPYFIQNVLKNNTYRESNIDYVDIEQIDLKKAKNGNSKKDLNFEELIDSGLNELSADELIDQGLDDLL